jgi:hypothetical protein
MKEMIEEVKAILGRDYTVETKQVEKANDITLTAFVIHDIKATRLIEPTVYYKNGMTPQDIVDKYKEGLEQSKIMDMDVNKLGSREYILSNVIPILYNSVKSANILADAVHVHVANLVIAFRVVVDDDPSGVSTYLVKTGMLDHAGITEQELYDAAMENIQGKGELYDIRDAILGWGNQVTEDDDPMIICITSNNKHYGASMIFDKTIRDRLDRIYSEYYLLPSSLHEMLAVPRNKMDVDSLINMVREVNATEVAPSDFLSDDVYIYEDRLKVA